MTASVTLNASITFSPYVGPEGKSAAIQAHWELALWVTSQRNATSKLFLLEKQYKRPGVWGVVSFVRVASKDDFDVYPYDAPTTEKYGYRCYLSDSFTQNFSSWDDANAAYARTRGQILSLLGVSSATEIAGALALRVVGVVPKRAVSTPYSMYPMDTITFTGVGGVRPYTYSLNSDDTSGSAVVPDTGEFTAACLVDSQVTVTVTDSAETPAQASILVTLLVPSSPPESEVLDV